MTIANTETVDALGIDPGSGMALLVITDDMDWSDPVAHLNALQAKIGVYIGFLQSGQLETNMPKAAGKPVKIGVMQQYEPPNHVIPILDGLGKQLEAMNIGFGYGPLPSGFEGPA